MIVKVKKIKDCPSFVDFKPEADLPDFKKYNLIYGWNGSGKTCFSRVLRSFELTVKKKDSHILEEYDHLRQRFTDFIREIALYRVSPVQPVPEFQDLKEITPMLAETVTRWTREWKKQGLMEGTIKGRAAALERQLYKRFGEIAPMYLEKIRNASIEQLDIWLERILDAKCIEDVFEP